MDARIGGSALQPTAHASVVLGGLGRFVNWVILLLWFLFHLATSVPKQAGSWVAGASRCLLQHAFLPASSPGHTVLLPPSPLHTTNLAGASVVIITPASTTWFGGLIGLSLKENASFMTAIN